MIRSITAYRIGWRFAVAVILASAALLPLIAGADMYVGGSGSGVNVVVSGNVNFGGCVPWQPGDKLMYVRSADNVNLNIGSSQLVVSGGNVRVIEYSPSMGVFYDSGEHTYYYGSPSNCPADTTLLNTGVYTYQSRGGSAYFNAGPSPTNAFSGCFDETSYLNAYPGVASQIASGAYKSGIQQYLAYGRGHGYSAQCAPAGGDRIIYTREVGSAIYLDSRIFSVDGAYPYFSGDPPGDVRVAPYVASMGVYYDSAERTYYYPTSVAHGTDASRYTPEKVWFAHSLGGSSFSLQQYDSIRTYHDDWNESGYLAAYPNVASAVASGQYKSGIQHFMAYGYNHGFYARTARGNTCLAQPGSCGTWVWSGGSGQMFYDSSNAASNTILECYSEGGYLSYNPDIAAAVGPGGFVSGMHHYVRYGRSEGRQACGAAGCSANYNQTCQVSNACGSASGVYLCNGTCSVQAPSGSANYGKACGPGNAGVTQCDGSCLCTPRYACSGQTIIHTNADCSQSTVNACVAPQYCSPGVSTCVQPQIVFNATTQPLVLTGHLQAKPLLVRTGDSAKLYWNVSNASSCSVRDGAGAVISTAFTSGTSGVATPPVHAQTVYVLMCQGLPGASPSSVTETQTINIVPGFQEI